MRDFQQRQAITDSGPSMQFQLWQSPYLPFSWFLWGTYSLHAPCKDNWLKEGTSSYLSRTRSKYSFNYCHVQMHMWNLFLQTDTSVFQEFKPRSISPILVCCDPLTLPSFFPFLTDEPGLFRPNLRRGRTDALILHRTAKAINMGSNIWDRDNLHLLHTWLHCCTWKAKGHRLPPRLVKWQGLSP